VFVCSKLFA